MRTKPTKADFDAAEEWLGGPANMESDEEAELVQLLADHREPRFQRTVDMVATGVGQGCGAVIGVAIALAAFTWWQG